MAVLKGLITGAFSGASFYLIIALFLEKLPPVVCFGLATLACLAVQIILLRFVYKRSPAASVSVACE
jgi:hypothetical protein